MIYLISISIFFISVLILIITNRHSRQTYLWVSLLIFYVISVVLFIIYLSKDLSYFSTFNRYFPLPTTLWNRLIQMKLSKDILIRLLNLSCLLFIYSNVVFCLSFIVTSKKQVIKKIKWVIFSILTAQFLLYDPHIYKIIYNFLYPRFIGSSNLDYAYTTLYKVTYVTNLLILLACVILMFWVSIKSPNIKFIKHIMYAMSINYTFLIASYLFILSWAPMLLIKYSKVANFTRYKTVSLPANTFMYTLFPYLLTVLFITGVLTLYSCIKTRTEFINEDITISRAIDAGTITSRVFCHYIKNELLAISAEVEEIESTPNNEQALSNILNRCDSLYERLNLIHKSTSDATLNLTTHHITDCILSALKCVADTKKLKGIEVLTSFPSESALVLIDKDYFEQTLINILFNAAEALIKSSNAEKKLSVVVKQSGKWVSIAIKDTGIGIKPEDLSRIFTPFYTTNPIKKNWGIGLSVSYKIITAHEGKISIKSQENVGTVFEILLPNAKI